MKTLPTITFIVLIACFNCSGQTTIRISGKVVDAKTNLPLMNATIGLKSLTHGTTSDGEGKFELIVPGVNNDTLFISYVGYQTFTRLLMQRDLTALAVALEEATTLLDEVVILEKKLAKFEIKQLEALFKSVKDNLYASKIETTNEAYTKFLIHLLSTNQHSLYKKYKPILSGYDGSFLIFFKSYHAPQLQSKETKYNENYDNHPVVNITHEAAIAYCEWLTEIYNSNTGKKKFKHVKFRLPTLKEWQIAALGYKKFQSWELDENRVDLYVADNPTDESGKNKKTIPVKGNDILYPWFGGYNYRNKAQNKRNCWLGNYKIADQSIPCENPHVAGDGFLITAKSGLYFPNGMGLYDTSGNVAEMIVEKGLACGGSWDHTPEESTIASINHYTGTSGAVGFRIFMEVIDEK